MNIGTRVKNLFKDMWNNTEAVSPVVATLVLVTVAIAGAAGVGMIQGTFSSGVAEDAGSAELALGSSTELLIAGSTTVQPVSELIAEAYMDDHQGTRVTVQGGGSGAGISSAGMGIVDIGAASKPVDPKDFLDEGYDLEVFQIGGSAVVVIAGTGIEGTIHSDELSTAYRDNEPDDINTDVTGVTANTTLFQRADASGTQDTFRKWLPNTTINDTITGETGNAGVLAAVQGNPDSIGFVDFGFADGADDINILGIFDYATGKPYPAANVDGDHIEDELANEDGKYYVYKLTRPLNYITNGAPSSLEQGFIDFARSPGATEYFTECGYFAITEFA